jgi:hypothetical protein
MRLVLVLLAALRVLTAQTFPATLKRSFWRGTRGELWFTAEGLSFQTKKSKDDRNWKYRDIQHFDRISPKELAILTYESQWWKLGREKRYRFVITSGELGDAAFHDISRRLAKPVTNRVVPKDLGAASSIPAKHLHTLGGCQGTLEFTADAIYYTTSHGHDARVWRLNREVQSVFSADPYRLDIQAYDDNRREFSQTRLYRFKLKEPLDQALYRDLKLKLYNLQR